MSRILPLPPETVSQIHSSRNITSLQGVVLALLENSLDAGARKVEITVDFRRGDCTVDDDGSGILPSEFQEEGGLGKLYHTSKHSVFRQSEVHGSTGTYLASLSALSLLNITSTHADRDYVGTLILHQGKVIARETTKRTGNEVAAAPCHGTCVTVRDLFGSMPVRVKQRALLAGEGTHDERAWLELKRGVVALLLAWYQPCTIRIRDSNVESRHLHLSSASSTGYHALTKRSLDSLSRAKTRFGLEDKLPLLSQADLAPVESRANWIPVSASTLQLAVKGAICADPMPTKQCQFISIGVQPCLAAAGCSELYEAINKVFVNSSFGSRDDNENIDEGEKDRRKLDRRYKSDGYTQKQLHGRKGVDRWPMFVLQIKFLERQTRSIEPERLSESSLKTMIDVLEAMITQWLTANHFRPRKPRRRKEAVLDPSTESPSTLDREQLRTPTQIGTLRSATTSKKRKYVDISGRAHIVEDSRLGGMSNQHSYFSTWSRIKSGRATFHDDAHSGRKPATAPPGQNGTRVENWNEQHHLSFSLPNIEAGELNSATPARSIQAIIPATASTASNSAFRLQSNDVPSSEDFGSLDEEAALDTIVKVDGMADVALSNANTSNADLVSPTESFPVNDAVVTWTDPVTKQILKVNARTGVVLPYMPESARSLASEQLEENPKQRRTGAIDTSLSSAGRPLSLARRPKTATSQEHRWLPGFLKQWDNPVFAQQEEVPIPRTSFTSADSLSNGTQTSHHCHGGGANHSQHRDFAATMNISKAALKDAKVIKQVDQKYILCKVEKIKNLGTVSTLVLIDQHAASERVILENLLSELCASVTEPDGHLHTRTRTTSLDKPLRFEVSEQEYSLFKKHHQRFVNWGIFYEMQERDEVLGTSQVRAPKREYFLLVQHLPTGIAERCVLVPKLLIELLRSEIWILAESAHKPKTTSRDLPQHDKSVDEEHGWLRRLGDCPKGILDMLNSRACRSAIMFNDELSIQQCEELLMALGKCAFPFMCAHGRVSMVPLGDTATALGLDLKTQLPTTGDAASESYTKAFTSWRGTDIVYTTDRCTIEDQV